MIEHAFYSVINLVQAMYIHAVTSGVVGTHVPTRLAAAMLATTPWLVRGLFPVNHFSDNWAKETKDPWHVILMCKLPP